MIYHSSCSCRLTSLPEPSEGDTYDCCPTCTPDQHLYSWNRARTRWYNEWSERLNEHQAVCPDVAATLLSTYRTYGWPTA